MNKYAIGNNLHKLLKERKMSQRQLADEIGVNINSMSKWMNGYMQPSSYSVYKAAMVLGVTMERLMEGIEDDT